MHLCTVRKMSLYGGTTFPNLADLVAADLCGNALGASQSKNSRTADGLHLRSIESRASLTFAGPRVPLVLGFDPYFSSFTNTMRTPLSQRFRQNWWVSITWRTSTRPSFGTRTDYRSTPLPIPEAVFPMMLGRFGLPRLPKASVNHQVSGGH